MKDLLKYLADNSINYFIIFNDKFEIIKYSNNIEPFKNTNIRSLIWLEDIARFELFKKNLKRDKWTSGTFEVSLNEKTYQKVQILGTIFEGNNLIVWGNQHCQIIDKKLYSGLLNDIYTQYENYVELIFDENFKITEVISNHFVSKYPFYDELQGKNILNFIFDEDKNEFKIFHQKVAEFNLLQKMEFRMFTNDDDYLWVEEYAKKVIENETTLYHCLIKDIDSHKRFLQNILQDKEQALYLANHLEKTREQERKNMAREIHDEIGHALTSLKLNMNLLLKKKFMREEMLISKLNDMMKQIEETIRTVQQISAQLRPSILDHFGLIAALEWQAKEFQRQTTIRCKYSLPDEDIEIPENKTIAIFRIFQEILTNIARHSQATRVDINLTIENNNLELQVSDNGIGIKKEFINSPTSLGLIGMQERAKLIGGKLNFNSVINVGTTITLNVGII